MIKAKKITVTGGAGFIGSHFTDLLLDQGYEVSVIDNLANGKKENLLGALRNERLKLHVNDIRDTQSNIELLKDSDIVFHLACLGVRHSIHSPLENHEVNAEGTLKLLQAAQTNKIKHFFYISTSEIYGRTSMFPIDETAPTNPLTVYGASKLAGEHYAKAYFESYGFNTTVLRIFNNFGPRADYEGDAGEIIPRSIVSLLYGKKPVIFGDGSITRDFFYVTDTARMLLSFLNIVENGNADKIAGEVFNVGTGIEISMKLLIEKIMEIMKKEAVGINFEPDRPADVPRLWVDNHKWKKMMNFEPAYDLDKGLAETVRYYEQIAEGKDLFKEIKLKNWTK